jgi:hypothetical protein
MTVDPRLTQGGSFALNPPSPIRVGVRTGVVVAYDPFDGVLRVRWDEGDEEHFRLADFHPEWQAEFNAELTRQVSLN